MCWIWFVRLSTPPVRVLCVCWPSCGCVVVRVRLCGAVLVRMRASVLVLYVCDFFLCFFPRFFS